MKTLASIFPWLFGQAAANETTSQESQLSITNEFKPAADNWVQLSPYGEFQNPVGLQRFTKVDAEMIANAFRSSLNPATRLMGLPWYIGHPDHPRHEDKYRDNRAYGRIKELDARADGLFANVKWSTAGKELIESESFHGHSVNWFVRKEGNVFRPFALKSVGFTNSPNIPVQPVTAANETSHSMKKLSEWLKQYQIELANEATEEQIATALTQLQTKIGSLVTAGKSESETALANERKTVGNLNGQVTTLTTELANERKARAGMLLDAATTEGRITKADRAGYETEFANEFSAAETKLKGEKKKLGSGTQFTASKLPATSRNNIAQITSMVNERMEKEHISYDEAHRRFTADKHELFVKSN